MNDWLERPAAVRAGDGGPSTGVDPGRRHVESSALTAIIPALAVIPVWFVALAVWWGPVHLLWHVSLLTFALAYLALGLVVLLIRPVQVRVLALLVGARRPTQQERATVDTAWRSVLQANRLPRNR